MDGFIGGKTNNKNKIKLFILFENYVSYCNAYGYTDFNDWCEDNIENEEQKNLLGEIAENVNAIMSLLCFD